MSLSFTRRPAALPGLYLYTFSCGAVRWQVLAASYRAALPSRSAS